MILLGIIFLLVGLAMAAGSAGFALWRKSFLKTAVSTVGTVIESGRRQSHNRQHHGGGIQFGRHYETWYYPVVRFQTANGQTIDHTSKIGTKTPYTEGQQIPINYDPKNPYSVKFGASGSFLPWLPFIFVGGIGLVFSLVGFVISVAAIGSGL